MTQTVSLSDDDDLYEWWDENDGEEAGIIYGLGGYDSIEGDVGDDIIYGGDGYDHLAGGNQSANLAHEYWGNDTLYGGNHVDTLSAGSGNDFLYGQNDDDALYGGDGN